MRLGGGDTILSLDSRSLKWYTRAGSGADCVRERHRHRYEVQDNWSFLQDRGSEVTGVSCLENRTDIIECGAHPFYIGTQFHPEFTSSPERPLPLFVGLLCRTLKRSHRDKMSKFGGAIVSSPLPDHYCTTHMTPEEMASLYPMGPTLIDYCPED